MPDVLDVLLHGARIGALIDLGGDRSFFAFDADHVRQPDRPTLSLSFRDARGHLVTKTRPSQTQLPPYFSNLLPEGPMRAFLARSVGVKPAREFRLLWGLGEDLPGAVTVRPQNGRQAMAETVEPDASERAGTSPSRFHFSLPGVQLKFSVVRADERVVIPVRGVGGDAIAKLPSQHFARLPENEFSIMTLAAAVGIEVPPVELVPVSRLDGLPGGMPGEGNILLIRRFDRSPDRRIHVEEMTQVFGLLPQAKYRGASYTNVLQMLAREAGDDDAVALLRRIVFSALVGNGDMHLKNIAVIYPDGRRPRLAPAYDLVSTIPYLPSAEMALTLSRTKRFDALDQAEIRHMAHRASMSDRLLEAAVRETVERFRQVWMQERSHLPLDRSVVAAVERQLEIVPLARGA